MAAMRMGAVVQGSLSKLCLSFLFGIGALAATTGGCGDYGPVTLASDDAGALSDLRARGVGEACGDGVRCRGGLTCTDGRCAPGHTLEAGETCVLSAECKIGLYCGPSRTCAPAGTRAIGESCGSEADCAGGARCNPIGLSAECQAEGAVDVGAACKLGSQCLGGLICVADACGPPPPTTGAPGVAVSSFAGVTCQDDPGPVRAYFRVPRGSDDGDFFRLPFPNDVRRKNGKLDLSGFPTPGADVLGYDLVDRWARYVEETATGFSAYPTITLRFSGTPDFDALKAAGVVKMIDVTANAGGVEPPIAWSATSAKTKYVCENSMSARPVPGHPLEPGHTYALLVTNGAKAPGGANIEVSSDLTAIVAGIDPGGPLSDAWAAYAPLRKWAASAPFDLTTLVNAAVFTVGNHTDVVSKLAASISAAVAPTVTSWVKCGAGPSPCPQADGARACGAPDAAFDELHALVSLTNWQQGIAPYRIPDEGGDVVSDGAGGLAKQGLSQVCLSLTIPKGTMPAAGWPLAIYAHDTGGHFRSHVTDGVAARMAAADSGAAAVAVLGIDQVGHGTRRGGTDARPEALWFASSNPRAMRGYALQAAADVLALAKLGPSLDLAAAASPTGAAVRFGSVTLIGHGQGASAVALAAPHAAVTGVVVGGVGASFLDAIITKRSPVDFADVAPAVLGETTLPASHPVLALLQNALDPSDPLDHAALLVSKPPAQATHAFAVYGRGDSYTPGGMQRAFTVAAGLGVAGPPTSVTTPDDLGAPLLPTPVTANVKGTTTAVVRQYDRGSDDGHFVMLRSPDAIRDIDRFVADLANGTIPRVGR